MMDLGRFRNAESRRQARWWARRAIPDGATSSLVRLWPSPEFPKKRAPCEVHRRASIP